MEETGLSSEPVVAIENVTTLAECCRKCQLDTDCEVAEFKEPEDKCEIHKNYDRRMKQLTDPTPLLVNPQNTFDLPKEEVAVPTPCEDPVTVPSEKEWKLLKLWKEKREQVIFLKNLNYTIKF